MVRKSNFELLRIVSMAMVVGLHYFNGNMGGALNQLNQSHYNYFLAYFFEGIFLSSVNCFILITGYFQIKKQSVHLNRVIELLLIMVFYGFGFYLLAAAMGWVEFSPIRMIVNTFPILVGRKWFIKVFIILYLFIPFINLGLNQLDKKKYQYLLLLMTLFFSVYPSFLPAPPVIDNGYGIITFVLMYSIGGYLRKFGIPEKSKRFYFMGYLILSSMTFVCSIFVDMVYPKHLNQVWGYNFIFTFAASIFLFLFFSKLDFKSQGINRIATYSLGVYYVHTDPMLNDFMYHKLLRTQDFWYSPWFILHMILSVVLVYAASTIIDMGRKWLFDKVGGWIVPFFKKRLPKVWEPIPANIDNNNL